MRGKIRKEKMKKKKRNERLQVCLIFMVQLAY